MKIDCYILTNSRRARIVKVDENLEVFIDNGSLYFVRPTFLKFKETLTTDTALIFYENYPVPIQHLDAKDEHAERDFIEELIFRKKIEAQAHPSGMMFGLIITYLKEPRNIIMLVLALILLYTFIGGLFL